MAALMPAADTVLLFVTVGVFIGTIMVGLAAVLVVLALAVQPARLGGFLTGISALARRRLY